MASSVMSVRYVADTGEVVDLRINVGDRIDDTITFQRACGKIVPARRAPEERRTPNENTAADRDDFGRGYFGWIAILGLSLGLSACHATAPPAPVVETVGTLAPSYRSIATAPVHATTDLSGGFQAVSGDVDDDATVATGGETVETPDVTKKAAHGF